MGISKTKNNEKPEKDHYPKQKLEEKMKIDGYSKQTYTHSLTYTDTRLHIHPHTHPHTHKIWGKGRLDRHRKLEITTLIENKKMRGKSCHRSTYTNWHQNSLIINFKNITAKKTVKFINICIFTTKW